MIRKVNKLMEGSVYFDNDDLVFTVLEKYLSPRDASWLQRNKQGLCKGDKVIIGEHILGLIAHEYAIHKFGPYVANNVGSVASYFSVMKPLTIDIKTGRVALPQCYLATSNLSRELKKQYNQLTWQLDEVFRDIAEEILVILDKDPIDRGEEIPYEYESIRRNRYRGLREGDASLKNNYAVIVYDMNTASYNLYTGTKKMCEQLYKDLFDFNIDDYDDDEKDDMYDWLYGRLNEFNCIERIDFRRGIDYRDNYSDGYDKYHIINYTKPRHPISLYL